VSPPQTGSVKPTASDASLNEASLIDCSLPFQGGCCHPNPALASLRISAEGFSPRQPGARLSAEISHLPAQI